MDRDIYSSRCSEPLHPDPERVRGLGIHHIFAQLEPVLHHPYHTQFFSLYPIYVSINHRSGGPRLHFVVPNLISKLPPWLPQFCLIRPTLISLACILASSSHQGLYHDLSPANQILPHRFDPEEAVPSNNSLWQLRTLSQADVPPAAFCVHTGLCDLFTRIWLWADNTAPSSSTSEPVQVVVRAKHGFQMHPL